MSSGMNVKEAEKIADKMSYREAIMNCLHAKCVPYRKATKIKMKRLLESIDNDFTDDLLNQGYTKGYQQGKSDGAREFAVWLEKHAIITIQDGITMFCEDEDKRPHGYLELLAEWQNGENL